RAVGGTERRLAGALRQLAFASNRSSPPSTVCHTALRVSRCRTLGCWRMMASSACPAHVLCTILFVAKLSGLAPGSGRSVTGISALGGGFNASPLARVQHEALPVQPGRLRQPRRPYSSH